MDSWHPGGSWLSLPETLASIGLCTREDSGVWQECFQFDFCHSLQRPTALNLSAGFDGASSSSCQRLRSSGSLHAVAGWHSYSDHCAVVGLHQKEAFDGVRCLQHCRMRLIEGHDSEC